MLSKMRTLSKVEWLGEGMDLKKMVEKVNVIKNILYETKRVTIIHINIYRKNLFKKQDHYRKLSGS